MPFLTIGAAADLRVLAFRRAPDEHDDQPHRVLDGALRGDPTWTARAWTAEVLAATDAEAAAVYAEANPFTPVACSGDVLPATVTCSVRITGDEYARHRNQWDRVLSLSLRESL